MVSRHYEIWHLVQMVEVLDIVGISYQISNIVGAKLLGATRIGGRCLKAYAGWQNCGGGPLGSPFARLWCNRS